MQTLRKRSSPCKYKNEPSRFLGEGMTFKAKLIGILEVNEARGDKMCQDALNDLKTAIRAAGEHKQRITISIAIDGLRLRDEKSGDCLYHHPVHKISYIAQDVSDSRAFGYIFGSPDTGHRFFGIKTDKTASQVVISMRDLFQVVFELKKKEIEMQRQVKYGSAGATDSMHSLKDDYDTDKSKGKYPQLIKIRCVTSKSADSAGAASKGNISEAIADLLDLEHELNSIQQGINQMDRITPSDPFGPISKGDPFLDPFEDSFPAAANMEVTTTVTSTTTAAPSTSAAPPLPEFKVPPPAAPASSKTLSAKARTSSQATDSPTELDKPGTTLFGGTGGQTLAGGVVGPTKASNFFSHFSPSSGTKAEETHWFDQETESLFNDRTNVSNTEPTSSPITFPTQADDQVPEGKKSPMKPDVFMELDPLGTGWVKPYVDKKDFFQDLKNPPKKVLKELATETTSNDSTPQAFLSQVVSDSVKTPQTTAQPSTLRTTLATASSSILTSTGSRYSKMDPFDDADPFEKTDPFSDKNFPHSIGLPSLFNGKSFDGVFSDITSATTTNTAADRVRDEDIGSPPSIFSSSSIHGPLRVSLPPEKSDTNTPISLSSITSKFRSSPSPPEESKTLRRRNYQVLKQSGEDRGDETPRSPVQDEFFCTSRSQKISSAYSPKTQMKFKEKSFSVSSMPTNKSDKMSKFWSEDLPETIPIPPPKPKAALFSIKPPPLPPKKQNQPNFKPPARPPSLEDSSPHYNYLKTQEEATNRFPEPNSPKLDKPKAEQWKTSSEKRSFPLLPPPPQRKTSTDKIEPKAQADVKSKDAGVLNLTLNQLDNSGLENLAVTLGIPADHIFNMTLQELTKRLSERYLNPSEATSQQQSDTFQADFESNFSKMDVPTNPAPYDKYAVFKELIENDNKKMDADERTAEAPETTVKQETEEEDRYAALRQLSMNPEKSENVSEDLDLSVEEDNNSDVGKSKTERFTPVDLVAESPVVKTSNDWPGEALVEIEQTVAEEPVVPETVEQPEPSPEVCQEETPVMEEKLEPEVEEPARDNWATFDKESIYEVPVDAKPPAENVQTFNDNENSPISSDGKDDSFNWHKSKERERGSEPWRDEDESWDEYSPKESYWSDKSSHDDRSPGKRRDRYQRRGWSKQMRKSKGGSEWCRTAKWTEDTEDECEEERWKNHRCRMGSGDGSGYDWCNSRGEPWEENDRYARCYTERRKRSESDDEYPRRCDSDTSDREYIWSFRRGFPEAYNRGEKQNQYHVLPYSWWDCPERCHEPRSKHRKGESHKRPSSASDGKRNYEKMYPGDHGMKKRGIPDEDQSPPYHKDFRYCCGSEPTHYYNSYDRRLQMAQWKKSGRSRRGEDRSGEQYGPGGDGKEKGGESFEFYKSTWHKAMSSASVAPSGEESRRARHFHFEDDFAPDASEKASSPQSRNASRSPRRSKRRDDRPGNNSKDGFFQSDNNNDNFTEEAKDKGRDETERPKRETVARNHFAALTRQESSASLRKSESINIFSRENDPFEGDDFFSSAPSTSQKLNRFSSEKSKSNSNVSDGFAWKEVFGDPPFHE